MNERFQTMLAWLETLPQLAHCECSTPVAASSDASFRRYFRILVTSDNASTSYIIMDAPVQFEDCRPFMAVSAQLSQMGLQVPQVLAHDLIQGFLLLTDLGDITYLSVLKHASESQADALYQDALQALVQLQMRGGKVAGALPTYDGALLHREMDLFGDWLLHTHLEYSMSGLERTQWLAIKNFLENAARSQPQTYVHRDFHSRNLMVTEQNNPGILDFQDAVHGAFTYDAVSLLRDCYIAWPAEQVVEWQRGYFLNLCANNVFFKDEWAGFQKSMDLMGIQRHLKAAGIFARLSHRDGKDGYLNDIPQTLDYIVKVGAQYSEMRDLVTLLEKRVLTHTPFQLPSE
ncbi:aminoglycoside phosphotransferase family protein [Thiomicrorhabdus aquaedulcis]|uniref:aminoglycoside phosphotransferase family protein n=1 Tax=Thiomicrorhabdus aquaedulcis TaxID=2211106 RepID=UPI000FDA4290|nr:phosphotransferase [Thiomicrorhabdus aquaedulcis]